MKNNRIIRNASKSLKTICICLLAFLQCFFAVNFSNSIENNKYIDKTTHDIGQVSANAPIRLTSKSATYSIFINEPTFTFVYENIICFIDNYDKKLKFYDTIAQEFKSEYIELASYGNIIDAVICDGVVYILSENNQCYQISKIDIKMQNIKVERLIFAETELIINKSYSKIFVNKLNSKFYIVLTPNLTLSSNNLQKNALVFTLNENTNILSTKTTVVFENMDSLDFKPEKVLITYLNDSTDYINMIFVSNSGIFGLNLETTLFEAESEIILDYRNFYRQLDSTNFDKNVYDSFDITDSYLLQKDGKKYLFITYKTTTKTGIISAYTNIYEINIALGYGSIFELKTTFNSPVTEYVTLSDEIISYPSNQEICLVDVIFSTENIDGDNVLKIETEEKLTISNPNLSISYLNESEFEYVKTNKDTYLLSSPWNSTGTILIPSGTNLIVIGNSYIDNESHTIEDYKYCLLSTNNRNYLGYVKLENITSKDKIAVEDYEMSTCTVISKSALYSLPTKVLGDKITNTLTSKILMNIPSGSQVQIIDILCNYTSNGSTFLKVKVGETIGYIETNQIQNKNNITVYNINNATIKVDGTKVYKEENDSSEILLTLNEGARVKIIKARNKQTGFCKIEYTDSLGNVVSGYVNADFVNSDSLSVMQIVGGILIAVNIGILLLIIHFLMKRMTKNANNIDEEEFISQSNDSKNDPYLS